jgi:anti-sigma B factor antagonist
MDASIPSAVGATGRCPACGGEVTLEELDAAGDTPCPHCGHLVWFLRKCCQGVVVLTFLPGLMTGSEAMGRVREVRQAVANSSRLILNLSHMRLVSSMFLGMLVMVHRRMVMVDGVLKLCGLNSDTMGVFRNTKLDRVFDICGDEQTALNEF